MNAVVGIDIGSSAIKAMLLGVEERNTLAIESQPLRSRIEGTPPGHFEENPRILREQFFEIVRLLSAASKKRNVCIEGIGFTGQMHGGLLVDSALEPVTHCITWQDKRGDEISESGKSYVEELEAFAAFDATGVGIKTGFLVTSLSWLNRKNAIARKAVHLLGMYDWLMSVCLGRAMTDLSSAAAWGIFDPSLRSWKWELLRAAGISESFLPEVAEPGAFLGTIDPAVAQQCDLDTNVRIHASIGDTQAAYLGSECASDEVLVNFGTGSQSLWETARHTATQGTDIRYLRERRFLACAPTLAGGEAYLLTAKFFQEIVRECSGVELSRGETLRMMDRLAEKGEAQGLRIDPIFQGSKFRDVADRASISGIGASNFHPSNVVCALIEGMAEEIAWPFFARQEARAFHGLRGGGSALRKNRALQDAVERRFGLPLHMGRFDEEAAAGAAMLALTPSV
ncbi:MAG TPA: FGGY family carbohydrate kinase [Candidatus Kapabacteria bacterium]|jgi:sugar (pentulose or hexulose) kinase